MKSKATTTKNTGKEVLMIQVNNLRSSIFFTMNKIIETSNVTEKATRNYKSIQSGTQVPDLMMRNEIAKQVFKELDNDLVIARNLAAAYLDLGNIKYITLKANIKKRIKEAESALAAGYDLRRLSNKNLNINGSSSFIRCGSPIGGIEAHAVEC